MSSAASAADTPISAATPESPVLAAVVPLVPAWGVDRTFDYEVPGDLIDKIVVGTLVRVPFGGRKVRGVVTRLSRVAPEREVERVAGMVFPRPVAPAPLPDLYEWLALRYVSPRGRAFERAVPPRVRVEPSTPRRVPDGARKGAFADYENGPRLIEAIERGRGGVWVVRPHPRHDRGELVADLVAAGARAGNAALVAVPEVHYGSLVLDVLGRAFPNLWRIDAGAGERSRAWAAMANGDFLAAGGRSVVFTPTPGAALIVIDEEHESVYKEDRSPRYDARRVAVERVRLQGGTVVFVSNTPSIEVSAVAGDAVVAPARADLKAARPLVELTARAPDGGLSPELHARIRDALREGRSVALLVPMRGYAQTLWCAVCRRSVRCPRCEAAFAFIEEPRAVECRRCGLRAQPPAECPSCGAAELRYLGRGSQRYAEQLARSFPRSPVVHMDRDAAEQARSWEGSGIYVTTWFGTKPELRPPVSLVGVLDADVLTRRVDFRAAEQAHQVLAELAAWAGPAEDGGRLLLQTDDPNHHAIQAVVRGDYDFFYRRELEYREELAYPPFSELVRVAATGAGAEDALAAVVAIARSAGARVLGPIAAPYPAGGRDARFSGMDGLQVLLKCPSAQAVAEGVRDILRGIPKGTRLRIDVDPR